MRGMLLVLYQLQIIFGFVTYHSQCDLSLSYLAFAVYSSATSSILEPTSLTVLRLGVYRWAYSWPGVPSFFLVSSSSRSPRMYSALHPIFCDGTYNSSPSGVIYSVMGRIPRPDASSPSSTVSLKTTQLSSNSSKSSSSAFAPRTREARQPGSSASQSETSSGSAPSTVSCSSSSSSSTARTSTVSLELLVSVGYRN